MVRQTRVGSNAEEVYYPVGKVRSSPTSPTAGDIRPPAEWPSSPCVIKNTFLHFLGAAEVQEQMFAEIDFLKGKSARRSRRPQSEPPVRSACGEDCEDDDSTQGSTMPSENPDSSPKTPATPQVGVESAQVLYCNEWEARHAMNSLELPITADPSACYDSQMAPYATPSQPIRVEDLEAAMQSQVYFGSANHQHEAPWLTAPLSQGGGPEISPAAAAPQQETAQEAAPRAPKEDPMSWESGVVTVMVRQIPRRFSQMQILERITHRGFVGVVNFLYLPFDMKKGINVGYCFVGFTEHGHALRFRDSFDGSFLDVNAQAKDKPLRVHPASVQGYAASCLHFSRTKTGQKQDRRFSPLFLGEDGTTPPEVALRNNCGYGSAENETYDEHYGDEHYGEQYHEKYSKQYQGEQYGEQYRERYTDSQQDIYGEQYRELEFATPTAWSAPPADGASWPAPWEAQGYSAPW